MLLLSACFPREIAAANSELVVTYSSISPVIDGSLRAEWNDTTKHVVNLTGAADVETWVYLKHNGTYIYIGLLVWQFGTHTLDQFTIFFDEGDDGSYGSGTRDNTLTFEQEDLKSCIYQQPLKDGFYNASFWRTFDIEIDFHARFLFGSWVLPQEAAVRLYDGRVAEAAVVPQAEDDQRFHGALSVF